MKPQQKEIMRQKELFYSTIANDFDKLQNKYDLLRRLEVIFDELLVESPSGKLLLDVGCGSGSFSIKALTLGAKVISLDIGFDLLEIAKKKKPGKFINGNALTLPFDCNYFDIVISSEVIEHTPDPKRAVKEMARVLKNGGTLALTCPNKKWQWAINLANLLHLSSFRGLENFPGFWELEEFVRSAGLECSQHFGFHPWPFQLVFMQKLSGIMDIKYGKRKWGAYMLNQAIIAFK
jgi:ubiquinone/menaquinone biosynthesis C-methylase UbiE